MYVAPARKPVSGRQLRFVGCVLISWLCGIVCLKDNHE